MKISELVKVAHENALSKGFWDDYNRIAFDPKDKIEETYLDNLNNNAIATRLALIHSEVSEALEALRKDDADNFAEELADVVIRVADLAGGLEIDLEGEIERKMEKNKARGYKHGKLFRGGDINITDT